MSLWGKYIPIHYNTPISKRKCELTEIWEENVQKEPIKSLQMFQSITKNQIASNIAAAHIVAQLLILDTHTGFRRYRMRQEHVAPNNRAFANHRVTTED